MKRSIFVTLIIILIGYIGASWYYSGKIVKFDIFSLDEDKKRLKIQSERDFGLIPPQEINFEGYNNIKLSGWYFKNPKPENCAVILLHGHSATRYTVLKLAPLFFPKGCDIITYDLRYHGKSEGDFGTYGYYDKIDLQRVFEKTKSLLNLKSNQIGVAGISMGAAVALQGAGNGIPFAFVLADCPYMDLHTTVIENAISMFGSSVLAFYPLAKFFAEYRANFIVEDVSPLKAASKITSPVFLIHSKEDKRIPFSHSVSINKNLSPGIGEIHVTEWKAVHGKSIDANYPEYKRLFDNFMKSKVKGFFKS